MQLPLALAVLGFVSSLAVATTSSVEPAPTTNAKVASPLRADAYRPAVGKPHGAFVLPSIEDRTPLSLSDFRGKKLLLIHFASW